MDWRLSSFRLRRLPQPANCTLRPKTIQRPHIEWLEDRLLLSVSVGILPGVPLQVLDHDLDHDGIDDRLEQSLAETYAPVIFMEPDESNYPANVNWILQQNQLWYSEQGLNPDQSKTIGGIINTQANLLGNADGSGATWVHPGSFGPSEPVSLQGPIQTSASLLARPLSTVEPFPDGVDGKPFGDEQLWYLGDSTGDDRGGAYREGSLNPADWVTYFHAYPTAEGGIMIQYWHTFSFNQFATFDAHGGDWDASIQVQLDTSLQLAGVYYSRHTDDSPGTLMPGTVLYHPLFSLYQGTHPYVTIDGGGHGAFASPADWSSNHYTTDIQTGTISWTDNPDDPSSLQNVNATDAGNSPDYTLSGPTGGTIWKTWDIGNGTEVRQAGNVSISLISPSSDAGGLINLGEYNPGTSADQSVRQASQLLAGQFYPLNGQVFIKYSGRWGTTNTIASDAPRGPVFQGFADQYNGTYEYTSWYNDGANVPAGVATAPWMVPPTTVLFFGQPLILGHVNVVNSATAFSLTASANDAAAIAGATQSYYRVYPSGTAAPAFTAYTSAFNIVGTAGAWQIDYYSVDALGDAEAVHSRLVTLSNPAVLATGGISFLAVRGGTIASQVLATFTDPGGAETSTSAPGYQISIDWGDQSGVVGASYSFFGQLGSRTDPFTIAGGHTYTDAGTYPITVTILHAGYLSTATSTASVRAVLNPVLRLDQDNVLTLGAAPGGSIIKVLSTVTPSSAVSAVQVIMDGVSLGLFSGYNTLIVYGQAGNDDIELGAAVDQVAYVYGGGGNDVLVGGAGSNALVGGDGQDSLTAGAGRDILIGGRGNDSILGGSGGDILIGDTTNFDAAAGDSKKALAAILGEWQSSDTYTARFAALNSSAGGTPILGGGILPTLGAVSAKLFFGSTVKDDSAADTVAGAPRALPQDWFFQGSGDRLLNVQAGEHINNNTPAAFANRTVSSPINEGSFATVGGTITEPDARDIFMLQINWGDGSPLRKYTFPAGSNGRRVTLAHRYAKPGNYSINLSWHDPIGPANHATLALSVVDVPPQASAGGDGTVAAGKTFVRGGSFIDPGPGPWTAVVDYGDGSGPQPLHLSGKRFKLRHKYKTPGTYHVMLSLNDSFKGVALVDFTIAATPS